MELVIEEINTNTNKLPTICLNMIVKNESKIITRLFDSVLPIIDCYCICDTGSTDDTVKIIKEYFDSKNILGKVVFEPFKNFCHNRNFAMQSCLGMSDFILLIDADMILEVKQFDKTVLNNFDTFTLLQGNENFYYKNVRIVRNNGLYSYVGVTHEFLSTPSNNRASHIDKDQMFINDVGDGGAKNDKFERDVRLLTEGIKEEPNNDRYYFYLANSYFDSGKLDEAINFYKQRIKMGGWVQEVWYSYYKIGLAYHKQNKIPDAIFTWMEGYDLLPERLEGLYEIIKHYRYTSKRKIAYDFYNIAKNILDKNHNRSDYLFVHNDVYTYKLFYEYTIIAAYLGITNINDQVVQLFNSSADHSCISSTLSNMKFYKDILRPIRRVIFDSSITKNINNEFIKFNSSSPCIIHNKNKDGYLMNVRFVNYNITDNGSYTNCDKYIITVNKLIELDRLLEVQKETWIQLNFEDRRYMGVEDVRIYPYCETDNISQNINSNKLLFIGTGYHKNNQIGVVSGEYDVDNCQLISNELTQNIKNTTCEKNWIFVDYQNSTHIIYNWHPLNICKLNKNNLEIVEKRDTPRIFSHIRGSTCGFKYTNNSFNEIWFVTHIVSYEQPRHYYHVIVVFNEQLAVLRYSAPFKFEGECIEYCLGIVVENEQVLISYSTWDRTSRIGVYDKSYIEGLLKYEK